MDGPSHWEDGAAIVGGTFFDLWEDEGALNFPDEHAALVFIEDQMIDLRSMYFTPGQPAPTVREEPGVAHLFANIGAAAFDSYVRVGHDSPTTAMHNILVTIAGKQAMYGHGNIEAFGLPGIVIRCWDKIQRLHNLRDHDGPVLFEPERDSWLDLVGYSVIALMWVNDWFMLDLGKEG